MEFRGLKTNVFIASFEDTLGRPSNAGHVTIDAHHGARGPNQIGGKHRYVPDAAAKIEHAHAWSDACGAKSTSEEFSQDGALLHQALAFGVAGAHGVIGSVGMTAFSRCDVRLFCGH